LNVVYETTHIQRHSLEQEPSAQTFRSVVLVESDIGDILFSSAKLPSVSARSRLVYFQPFYVWLCFTAGLRDKASP